MKGAAGTCVPLSTRRCSQQGCSDALPLPWGGGVEGVQAGSRGCICIPHSLTPAQSRQAHKGKEGSHRPSFCPLVCSLEKGWGDGSCGHRFRIRELGHPRCGSCGRERGSRASCTGTSSPRPAQGLCPELLRADPKPTAKSSSSLPKSHPLCPVPPLGTCSPCSCRRNSRTRVMFVHLSTSQKQEPELQGKRGRSLGPREVVGLNPESPSGQ